jgi:hypothetical protein
VDGQARDKRNRCLRLLHAAGRRDGQSEKDTKLAQKLGQLQSFIAVFAQECMGQLAPFEPT